MRKLQAEKSAISLFLIEESGLKPKEIEKKEKEIKISLFLIEESWNKYRFIRLPLHLCKRGLCN